jgi:hypothetical protein
MCGESAHAIWGPAHRPHANSRVPRTMFALVRTGEANSCSDLQAEPGERISQRWRADLTIWVGSPSLLLGDVAIALCACRSLVCLR